MRSWLDSGYGSGYGNRYGNRYGRSKRSQYTPRYRQTPRYPQQTGSPVVLCLQQQDSFAQQQCLLPLLSRGAFATRSKHLRELLRTGKRGLRPFLTMLKQGNQPLRTFLMKYTLQDETYIRTTPHVLVYALFKVAKQDFLETLPILKTKQRIAVAIQLSRNLRFYTRKRITKEFRPYLKLPAQILWRKIQQERNFSMSMAMVSLTGCAQGSHQTPKSYTKAMLALQTYFTIWQMWNYSAKVSGARAYLRALQAYKRGRLRYRPRPRFNKRALRLAIVLSRKLRVLRPIVGQAIGRVTATIPRLRLQGWYRKLLKQSPRGSLRGRKKTKKRGTIEL